jgi:hypothetical protein
MRRCVQTQADLKNNKRKSSALQLHRLDQAMRQAERAGRSCIVPLAEALVAAALLGPGSEDFLLLPFFDLSK